MKMNASKFGLIAAWFLALGVGFSGGLVLFEAPEYSSNQGPRLPYCDQKPLDGPNCIARDNATMVQSTPEMPARQPELVDQVARVLAQDDAFGR